MKNITYYILFFIFLVCACEKPYEEKDVDLGAAPSVSFTPTVDNDTAYIYNFITEAKDCFLFNWNFGDGKEMTTLLNTVTNKYTFAGTYTVTILACGKAGKTTYTRDIIVTESDPTVCINQDFKFLTGGCDVSAGRTWVIDRGKGALGVGPLTSNTPDWNESKIDHFDVFWAPTIDTAMSCMYRTSLNFKIESQRFTLKNDGRSVYNWYWLLNQLGKPVEGQYKDGVLPYTPPTDATWNIYEQNGKKYLKVSQGSFLAYYDNTNNYEIMKLNDDTLYVRNKYDCPPALNGWGGLPGYRYLRFLRKH